MRARTVQIRAERIARKYIMSTFKVGRSAIKTRNRDNRAYSDKFDRYTRIYDFKFKKNGVWNYVEVKGNGSRYGGRQRDFDNDFVNRLGNNVYVVRVTGID